MRTRAKRASYRHGVAWIAENDEAGNGGDSIDVEIVSYYVSTLLLADLFGKPAEEVGADIVRYRIKHKIGAA